MRVALYARVSSVDQNVDQQMLKLRQFAKAQGWSVEVEVKDTESGRLPLSERRQFSELLTRLELLDAVVVFNIDRLTRFWPDQAVLEQAFRGNCRLLSLSDDIDLQTASGRLMFRLKMAVACYMPEDMREKQVVGIERAKKEGKYKGGRKGRKWTK